MKKNHCPRRIIGCDCKSRYCNALKPSIFPKSRALIADAIEEAIFDAFGMQPPETNSRPLREREQAQGRARVPDGMG